MDTKKLMYNFGLTLLWALLCLTCASNLMAQLNKGSVTGIVKDQSGAVVPGVQVVLTNDQTQTKQDTKSDSDGYYIFASVVEGTYTLTATSPSFKTFTQTGIIMNAGYSGRVDVTLQVGSVTEQVSVVGAAPVIETRDSTLNDVVDYTTLTALPLELNGGKRDVTAFEAAIPGYQGGSGFQTVYNGSIGLYGEMLVDGASAECNPAALGGCLRGEYSAEVISEFKVADATDASSGFSAGSMVSMTSKSGTNTLHGGAYEYLENNALDSRCFFCTSVAKNQQHEFGFTIGGPVYIPKVYNGRNKTFFFFNLEWFRYNYSVGGNVYTVPDASMREGNFTEFLGAQLPGTDALGNPVYKGEIYNPTTATTVGGAVVRMPYNNGGINIMNPLTDFSAVSTKYQALGEPLPNLPGLANNFVASGGTGIAPDHELSLKIDQYFGTNQHLSVFYWNDANVSTGPWPLPPILAIRNYNYGDSHPVHSSWTWTMSPSTVNEVVAAVDRVVSETTETPGIAAGKGASLIGQPNSFGPCLPGIRFGVYTLNDESDLKCGQEEGDTNYRVIDNLSHQMGKHLLKVGGNYIHWAGNFPVITNGYFGFSPTETGQPGAYLGNTGNVYASMLTGQVDNSTVQAGQYQAGRSYTWGLYVQDEYHVSPKLTLNLGLRYDAQPFPLQGHDQLSQFLPNEPNPGAGGLLGAVGFAGTGAGSWDTGAWRRLGTGAVTSHHDLASLTT